MRRWIPILALTVSSGLCVAQAASAAPPKAAQQTPAKAKQVATKEHLQAAKTSLEEAQQALTAKQPAKVRQHLSAARDHLRQAEEQSPEMANTIRKVDDNLEKAEVRAAEGKEGFITSAELNRAHRELDSIIRRER